MNKRVVITGMGAVTPVGNSVEATWEALVAGRSGVGQNTLLPVETFSVQIAALVKDFDPDKFLPHPRLRRYLTRATGFGVGAITEALAKANVGPDTYAPAEKGLAMGSSVGRPDIQEMVDMAHTIHCSEGREFPRQLPRNVMLRDQNAGMTVLAMIGQCCGPMITVSTACTGSAHAIGEAYRRIQEGDAKLMIAGGYDSLTNWMDLIGFTLVGALATEYNATPEQASRPFDRNRSGFVLGEGAVVIILEELEAARARNAPILAEIVGYGSSMNAYRITDAPPNGEGVDLAMFAALEDACLPPETIDYIVAHGTSTPGNDLCETVAIKKVFGDHAPRLAISSVKSMTGHLTSAAGSLNLLAGVCAIQDQIVPPTINLDTPDPKLDLDYVPNVARRQPVKNVMVNAFAFGGTNASLVVRAYEDRRR